MSSSFFYKRPHEKIPSVEIPPRVLAHPRSSGVADRWHTSSVRSKRVQLKKQSRDDHGGNTRLRRQQREHATENK